jgi:hypothetical protein|tara:strand:- start:3402 stop:3986 length:585 start_codon:yes stop_codon:yes gene_type:complete
MVIKREYFLWFAILVLAVLFLRKETEIVEVTLPVRTNTKVITNPLPINEGNKTLLITNFKTIKVRNPVNDTLVKRYLAQRDSLSRLNTFIDAVRLRDYVELLDDSLQTIKVESRVNGYLREQIITYTTKPQKVEVEIKDRKRLYAGAELVMPTQGIKQTPTLGAMINLVSQKNVLTVGYDLRGTVKVGLTLRIF